MSFSRTNRKVLAHVLGSLLPAILLLAGSLALTPTAQAANGQCKWEGGPGAPTHAVCSVEDCLGKGGMAQCSRGVGAVQSPLADDRVGPDKWAFSAIEDYYNPIFTNPYYCEAAGGWFGTLYPPYGNHICQDLPADILGGGGRGTNSESRLFSIAKSFADAWVGEPASSCGGTAVIQSDTGWVVGTQSLGIVTAYSRDIVYKGASCSDTIEISFAKRRSARCLPPSTQRTAVTGPECYTPGDVCVEHGNPVSMLTGAKYQREVDYAPAADTGLELSRHYKSSGFYWPTYLGGPAAPDNMTADDFWGHTYDRRFIPVTGNAEVSAIVRRPDCSVIVFDTAGNETTNRGGTYGNGAKLQALGGGGGWDLTLSNADVEHYDNAGHLTSITSRGRVTTLAYGSNGKVATVTGPFGHTLTFGYTLFDGVEMLTSLTLPDSGVIEYEYDSYLRPISVTYPDDTSRQYEYGGSVNRWQLTGIFDEAEEQFGTYVYNSAGRVTSESHAGGAGSYTFSYATVGGVPTTTVTDPLGTATLFGMTAAHGAYRRGTFSQQCLLCGGYASTIYDAKGNPAVRTDFNGTETRYTFDTARNLETSRVEAYGTPSERTISTQWHATLRLPSEITEPGRTTAFTYDGAGNMLTQAVTDTATSQSRTWTMTYTGLGQLLSIDGPRTDLSDVTTFTYHACTTGGLCGQLHTVTDAANNLTTISAYNAHGLPTSVTDPNGALITLAYDDRQRLTSRTVAGETTALEYWPTGLLKKVTQPDGSFVSYGYDAAHRLTSVTDTAGNTLAYTLNGAGQRLTEEVRDPLDVLTYSRTFTYNNLGRLIEEQGSASQTTSYVYDSDGNVIEIEDPLGRVTSQVYDELDRLATLVDAALQFTEFDYDDLDNLLAVTDPRALTTSYARNGFGETTGLTSPDTGTSSSTLDAAGNLDSGTDARSETADFTHDGLGRVTEIEYADETVSLVYDQGATGKRQLTSMADGSGTTAWSYDTVGRVTESSHTMGSVTLEVGYGYDTFGRLASLTTPSGQAVTYEYTNGQISGLRVNAAWILSQVAYQPFGPIRAWQWGNGTSTTRTYDTDGQLTQVSSAGSSSYTFFPDGMISARTDDFSAPIPSTPGTATFTLASTSNRVQAATGQLTRSYSYDAAGNTISDGTRTFTYNDAGRMETSTSGGVTTTYAYNGLGERVQKTSSAATALFAYDEAGHLIGEYDAAGDLIQETVWLGDIPVAVLKPTVGGGISVFYIHTDHLNTPRRITRPSDNAILWRWDSDPFGATAANDDPDGDTIVFAYHHRFPGQYFDAETGLHYNYFRDYDPITGRYTQSDPIGLAGGISTYGYGAGNPLAFVDPLGLDLEVIVSYRQFYGHVDIRIDNRVYGNGRFDVPGRELRSGGLAGTNVLRVTDAAAHKQSLAACTCEATGYVLDVTPQQEAEVLRFFRNQMAASSPVPARPNNFILPDDYSIATNNCATNARDALQSGLPWFLDPLFLGVMAPGAMETRLNTVARPLVKERTRYSTPVSPAP